MSHGYGLVGYPMQVRTTGPGWMAPRSLSQTGTPGGTPPVGLPHPVPTIARICRRMDVGESLSVPANWDTVSPGLPYAPYAFRIRPPSLPSRAADKCDVIILEI